MPKRAFQGPLPFHCEDKEGIDPEPPQKHMLSLKRGSKVGICGETNRGKSSLVKSFLIFSSPFKKIFVIHGHEMSAEYALVDHTPLTMEEATPEFWAKEREESGGAPMCLICDDIAWQDHTKVEKANSYKILQFVATHCNLTCIFVAHTYVALPPRIRRLCDTFVIYPPLGDFTQANYIARGFGVSKRTLLRAFRAAAKGGKYEFVLRELNPPSWRPSWRISGYKRFDAEDDECFTFYVKVNKHTWPIVYYHWPRPERLSNLAVLIVFK